MKMRNNIGFELLICILLFTTCDKKDPMKEFYETVYFMNSTSNTYPSAGSAEYNREGFLIRQRYLHFFPGEYDYEYDIPNGVISKITYTADDEGHKQSIKFHNHYNEIGKLTSSLSSDSEGRILLYEYKYNLSGLLIQKTMKIKDGDTYFPNFEKNFIYRDGKLFSYELKNFADNSETEYGYYILDEDKNIRFIEIPQYNYPLIHYTYDDQVNILSIELCKSEIECGWSSQIFKYDDYNRCIEFISDSLIRGDIEKYVYDDDFFIKPKIIPEYYDQYLLNILSPYCDF